MSTRRRPRPRLSAEQIGRLAEQGKDISRFFTNRGRMMPPLATIEVDFPADLLAEVEHEAAALNVSREALIKTFVRQALDRRHLAEGARRTG
jgi:hypothetical protein